MIIVSSIWFSFKEIDILKYNTLLHNINIKYKYEEENKNKIILLIDNYLEDNKISNIEYWAILDFISSIEEENKDNEKTLQKKNTKEKLKNIVTN